MNGRDFIFTGLQNWEVSIGSNAIDMAKEIAKNNRVLYVNSALDHMTLLRGRGSQDMRQRLEVLKRHQSPLRQITGSLWVLDCPFSVWSVNMLPDGRIFDFFNKQNNAKMFRFIQETAGELHFKNVIHFIDNDIYRSFYAKEFLKPQLSVYYRRDNLLPVPYWKKHACRLEPMLIRKSDLVVCNSPQLADFARLFNEESFDIGQGLDLSAYDPDLNFPTPEQIQSIPMPRIGYIGDINSFRLDATLLYDLAKSKPDYSFVMIGPEDKLFTSHALHKLQNVYFLGATNKQQIPAYLSSLQVCLNPQLINEITNGNYPRKVDEYLAMGKPVVASRTDTMQLFREHTYLCSSLQEYQDAIEKALRENNPTIAGKRMVFAQTHSWENNVNRLYERIEAMEKIKTEKL